MLTFSSSSLFLENRSQNGRRVRFIHLLDQAYFISYIPFYVNCGGFVLGIIGGILYCEQKRGNINLKKSKVQFYMNWNKSDGCLSKSEQEFSSICCQDIYLTPMPKQMMKKRVWTRWFPNIRSLSCLWLSVNFFGTCEVQRMTMQDDHRTYIWKFWLNDDLMLSLVFVLVLALLTASSTFCTVHK